MDEGLAKAARTHTAVMAMHHQISHDFSGEPALPQRLAATSSLLLSGEGENVGYTQSVASAHTGFMNSPHHRENLLDPDFNVVGFGIVHAGGMVYVTQDFARSLPNYSPDHARSLVAKSVQQGRSQAGNPELEQKDNAAADSAACAMAQADSLSAPALAAHYIVRFTTMQPQELPDKAHAALADPAVKSYSAGVCYKRTQSYPQGAYWVILLFY
jgi:hypothetical protein